MNGFEKLFGEPELKCCILIIVGVCVWVGVCVCMSECLAVVGLWYGEKMRSKWKHGGKRD